MTGRLVVVGTPIGNLEDISPRAVRALGEATLIYCEDTRRTRKLLSALGVPAPRLVRLDRHTEGVMVEPAVQLVRSGSVAALVSDAGMPTISDPGALLVKGVAAAGLPTEVVPGPCAVSAALAVSGMPASQYRFAGFLPRKGSDRRTALAAIAAEPATVVVYEAANRVAQTVSDLSAGCGPERELAAVRELTKLHEEVWRGTLGEAERWLADAPAEPRGEWVLVIGPGLERPTAPPDEDQVAAALRGRLAGGLGRREAVAEVAAEMGVPKRVVYDVALTVKDGG